MGTNDMALDILGGCEIMPLDETVDFSDNRKFTKLDLTQGQKMQLNALAGQLPALAGMDILSNSMVIKFPEGVQGTLVKLKNGGHTLTLRDSETGKFNGTAWLESLDRQATVLGVFTVMSIASGQYFLSQINSSLAQISLGVDKILEFLYGDKRAELLSEVSFIRFAYENYASVMEHSEQRIATLISLQNAKKVAMKDIEFYLSDLSSIIKGRKTSDISTTVPKMIKTKECLDLSLQLYTMSNLLEIYYAQNYDSKYISFMESEASEYISRCEKRSLSCFSQLQQLLAGVKEVPFTKIDKAAFTKQVDGIMAELETPGNSQLQITLQSALNKFNREKQYCISNGEVYLKVS